MMSYIFDFLYVSRLNSDREDLHYLLSRNFFRATLPPSFALEVFVQCEGEARFRRLCQPFLYSHSSSNVLEVEVINVLCSIYMSF